MPTADNTPARGGTITVAMPSDCANSQACSGPAPPKATRANPAGSTPRDTLTVRSAPSMLAATTASTPSAATPACPSAVRAAATSSAPRAPWPSGGMRPSATLASVTVGRRAAPAVGGGPRHGARRPRADRQRPARVDRGDRPAARPHRVDVQRRQPQRVARQVAIGRRGRLAAQDETHVGGGPTHVKGDGVGHPAGGGHVGGRQDAPGRSRQRQTRGLIPRYLQGHQATGGGHHQHRVGHPVQPPEVAAQSWPEGRIEHGGGTPLVLPEQRRDLVAGGDVPTLVSIGRRDHRLVGRVEVGMQQAHGQRLDAIGNGREPARGCGASTAAPSGPSRSATSSRSPRATRGGGRSIQWSASDGRCWRPISIRSANPSVPSNATRASVPSSTELVATVVPCASSTPTGDGSAQGHHARSDRIARIVRRGCQLDDRRIRANHIGEGAAGVHADSPVGARRCHGRRTYPQALGHLWTVEPIQLAKLQPVGVGGRIVGGWKMLKARSSDR